MVFHYSDITHAYFDTYLQRFPMDSPVVYPPLRRYTAQYEAKLDAFVKEKQLLPLVDHLKSLLHPLDHVHPTVKTAQPSLVAPNPENTHAFANEAPTPNRSSDASPLSSAPQNNDNNENVIRVPQQPQSRSPNPDKPNRGRGDKANPSPNKQPPPMAPVQPPLSFLTKFPQTF